MSAPKASTRTGPETSLTFVNRTSGDVKLFWLDANGGRQSYGQLSAGTEREQHTFAGHGIGERPYGKRRRQDFFVRHLLGVEPRSAAR